MEYHLINATGKDLQFPVPFSEYEIKQSANNKTINVLNYGEITWFGDRKLKEWSLSNFFPSKQYNFCQTSIWNMRDYINFIQKIIYTKKPCRFVVTETSINYLCTIEDFTYGEKDGTSDVYFTMNLKEYRSV
jgi:hypothetical protein